MWFRQDLRIADNPAFLKACETSHRVLPIYILDDENSGRWKMGAASRWWLHQSLRKLYESLEGNLCLAKGDARSVLERIALEYSVEAFSGTGATSHGASGRDSEIKKSFRGAGIAARSWNGSLLVEPLDLVKDDGEPYRVFTPFFKNCWRLRSSRFRVPFGVPPARNLIGCKICELGELELLPRTPWYREMDNEWSPGELGAQIRLRKFLKAGVEGYKNWRDYPARRNVSRLSPHLHFGEISPNQIWSGIAEALQGDGGNADAECFFAGNGLARVFLHLAVFQSRIAEQEFAREVRRISMAGKCRLPGGLAKWTDRLSDRGCRNARALEYRLHAQPSTNDRGLVPGQKFAFALALRRKLVLGHARLMPIWRTIAPAGNGSRGAAPTPFRTFGSSIR